MALLHWRPDLEGSQATPPEEGEARQDRGDDEHSGADPQQLDQNRHRDRTERHRRQSHRLQRTADAPQDLVIAQSLQQRVIGDFNQGVAESDPEPGGIDNDNDRADPRQGEHCTGEQTADH